MSAPPQVFAQSHSFTTLDDPSVTDPAAGMIAYGINNLGQVVGGFDAETSGFLYSRGDYTNIVCSSPPAFGTTAHGVNDSG
jgi:probable HAF family extracellular repeat protein